MCSVAASMATMAFNKAFHRAIEAYEVDWKCSLTPQSVEIQQKHQEYMKTLRMASAKGAMFDARVFNIPKEEVTNLIYWRQLDAIRNSIQMVGQAHFSQTELNGKCNQEIIDMLIQQKDIDWNKLKIYKQRGTCIIRSAHSSFLLNGKQITADTWSHDFDIPRFIGEGRNYIERYLYPDDPNNTTSRKDGNN